MKNSKNIDKIFSEGLHAYERQPRSQAWEILEARLQKPQSKVLPIWWKYASAASVALLLGIGGYWFNSQKESEREVLAIKTKTTQSLSNLNSEATELINNMPKDGCYSKNTNEDRMVKHICPIGTIIVDYSENKILEEKIEYPFERQEIKQIAKLPTIESKNVEEQNTIVLVLENTKPKVEEETIVLNMVESKPEVVTQATLSDINTKKETRLSKIWQQLKRAKNGENVNWSEVGIKPQKMLARADAKIENVLTKGENNEE